MDNVLPVPLDLIEHNPWQTRTGEDPDHVAKIAESIKAEGLLQVPTARQVGDGVERRYQLAFGHSRLAAYRALALEYPQFGMMPLNVRELTDRQMSDMAAAENAARKDLTAIETARAIQRRIADFGLGQAEAGKPFGLQSQSAVSNLLRLLKLPEGIQQQVHAGTLPERHARELVRLAVAAPAAAAKVADAVSKAEPGRRDNEFDHAFDDALAKNAQRFDRADNGTFDANWDMDWVPGPFPTRPDKGEPAELPACAGCPFFLEVPSRWREGSTKYCLRAACFAAKQRAFTAHELARASKALGIPVANESEAKSAEVAWAGDWDTSEGHVLLKTQHPSLRLGAFVPRKNAYDSYQRARAEVLKSERVVLLTTDADGLRKAVRQVAPKPVAYKKADADAAKRRQMKQRAEQLVASASCALAPQFPARWVVPVGDALMRFDDKWKKATPDERSGLLVFKILDGVLNINYFNPPTEKKIVEHVEAIAAAVGAKLPSNWQQPPAPKVEPKPKAKPKGRAK